MLWKASASGLSDFDAIRLDPHEERIRQMLLSQDPGNPDKYGYTMNLLESESSSIRSDWIVELGAELRMAGYRTY
jgi:hypothetical protein